jgi:hypothetical protein
MCKVLAACGKSMVAVIDRSDRRRSASLTKFSYARSARNSAQGTASEGAPVYM